VTWAIRQAPPAPGRRHVLDATKGCAVCGMSGAAIAEQPGTKPCDGGAALRRQAADRALAHAVARGR
jgi:hypothetical protein